MKPSIIASLRERITGRGPDRPGDLAPDDDFLDAPFAAAEIAGPDSIRSLTATEVRIPWDQILGNRDDVVFVTGWERRGAPVMNPIGLLNHWTAGRPSAKNPSPSFVICRDGDPSRKIPGPLIHLLIDYAGTVHVIASGRANHAGTGNQKILDEIRSGRTVPTLSAAARKLPDTGGSGGSLIGIEIEARGDGTPLPAAQYAAWTRTLAQIADWYSWPTPKVCWHHALWTRRKIDFTPGKMPPWSDQLPAAVSSLRHWKRELRPSDIVRNKIPE